MCVFGVTEWEVNKWTCTLLLCYGVQQQNYVRRCNLCSLWGEHRTLNNKTEVSAFLFFEDLVPCESRWRRSSHNRKKKAKHIHRIMRVAFFHLHCCGRTMSIHTYIPILVVGCSLQWTMHACGIAALTPHNDARLASPDYIWYASESLVLCSCSSSSSSFSLFICSSLDCGFS